MNSVMGLVFIALCISVTMVSAYPAQFDAGMESPTLHKPGNIAKKSDTLTMIQALLNEYAEQIQESDNINVGENQQLPNSNVPRNDMRPVEDFPGGHIPHRYYAPPGKKDNVVKNQQLPHGNVPLAPRNDIKAENDVKNQQLPDSGNVPRNAMRPPPRPPIEEFPGVHIQDNVVKNQQLPNSNVLRNDMRPVEEFPGGHIPHRYYAPPGKKAENDVKNQQLPDSGDIPRNAMRPPPRPPIEEFPGVHIQGQCQHREVYPYNPASSSLWATQVYYSESQGQVCVGDALMTYGCSHPVGCDVAFGARVCYDAHTESICLESSDYFDVYRSIRCQEDLGCY